MNLVEGLVAVFQRIVDVPPGYHKVFLELLGDDNVLSYGFGKSRRKIKRKGYLNIFVLRGGSHLRQRVVRCMPFAGKLCGVQMLNISYYECIFSFAHP